MVTEFLYKNTKQAKFFEKEFLQRFICLIFLNINFSIGLFCQTISGTISQLPIQYIKLEGFNGMNTYTISQTKTDEKGNFSLTYLSKDYGIGYLMATNDNPLLIILNGEDIILRGESLSQKESLQVVKGQENKQFVAYANSHPKREQALSAWLYLQKVYKHDTLFNVYYKPKKSIQAEILRIKKEDDAFINALPKNSYLRWYLPIRKLVSSASVVAQQRTDEIPSTIQAFRLINYANPRLYKSGLFKDVFESHFWLIENSDKSIEEVFQEMKLSIDSILLSLSQDEKIFNEATNYLFDLFERHSLFQASEYLAIKVLNETSCIINNDLVKQLETYRAMKKGNIAQDIAFNGFSFKNGTKQLTFNKLSDIKTPYTLVVFGASWCPKCNEELPKIAKHYSKWLTQGLEVVYVSLETDQKIFLEYTKSYPFISYCDFKKWDGQVVQDYYVFATPTMFLLDDKQKIILRPHSVAQMDAWVDWFLIPEHKLKE